MLCALAGTADARGYEQWKKVNRFVRRGAKAVWILAPRMRKVIDTEEDGSEIERTILFGFRSVPVFRVEDTDGDPLPESDDQYEQWVKNLPLVEVAEAWGISVGTYTNEGDRPLGLYRARASEKAILLGSENLSTWTHELVHAADHRLHGLPTERAYAEVVAELGSAVLLECLSAESDKDLGGAYRYIQHYAESQGMSLVKACLQVLDRVCASVSLILDTAEQAQQTNLTDQQELFEQAIAANPEGAQS